jgi:hypothetical protein
LFIKTLEKLQRYRVENKSMQETIERLMVSLTRLIKVELTKRLKRWRQSWEVGDRGLERR